MSHALDRIVSRRKVLASSAALVLPWLLPRSTVAQGGAIAVPTVDRLVVTVITDSSYDTPRVSTSNWVKVRRVGLSSPTDYRKTLHNEWGLALALESRAGTEARRYLLDFGYTVEALLNNMDLVGVDPTQYSTYIVSHGHFDHYGGLIPFLQKNRARLPAELTLYVGGEDAFCRRYGAGRNPGELSEFGVLDRRDLAALKVKVVLCPQPTVVGQAFTTGFIERTSFERVLPNTQVEFGIKDGAGCDAGKYLGADMNGKMAPDEHRHEHASCFHVKDKGLVVISSCGHVGIVNSVRQAQQVSGVQKVHAIVGGFHLGPAQADYLTQVVAEIKKLQPDVVIPMHCSGLNFVAEARAQMPNNVLVSTTGCGITFAA